VAALGARVAEALHYAHAQGILHRDVKPSNLLLDAQGAIWVTDFGLARVEGLQELTGTGDIVGTLRYMAPERFRGQADARSDVYSLGLTLYELLTLRAAFDEADRPADPAHHPGQPAAAAPVPAAPAARPGNDCAQGHRPGAGTRYQTAQALAEDLERFRNDRPILARPIRWWGRLLKWAKRRPAVATLLLALATALLGCWSLG